MDSVNRPALMTALFAILIGMVPQGCGDTLGQMAQVRVVMSGVTMQTNAIDIILAPGTYDFVATGVADADSADITLTVYDWQGAQVTSIQLSLTLAEANATQGDTGWGESTGVPIVEGVQSVTIDFRWQGTTPTADVDVNMDFFDNPDIYDWGAEPPDPVEPATIVSVWVKATNNEGPQDELTVESQFIDPFDGSVVNTVTLAFVGDVLFEEKIEAPGDPGAYHLRIVATDNRDGITQHERTYIVQ